MIATTKEPVVPDLFDSCQLIREEKSDEEPTMRVSKNNSSGISNTIKKSDKEKLSNTIK